MTTAIARPARAVRGFDTDQKLTIEQAGALRAAGYDWCARYVPLPGNRSADDIDLIELGNLLTLGFEVTLVQHVRGLAPWRPSDHSGHDDGLAAAHWSLDAGFPKGAHIFVDLENIDGPSGPAKTYAESWAAAVRSLGLAAGCYVGFDVPLPPMDLWLLRGIDRYWSDAGPRSVSNRGFCVKQHPTIMVAGVEIDPDEIGPDLLGDVPWVAAAPDATAA